MKHLLARHQKVISEVIQTLLAYPEISLAVDDGEGVVQHPSRNRAMIEHAIGHTPETRMRVFRRYGPKQPTEIGLLTLRHTMGDWIIGDADFDVLELLEPARNIEQQVRNIGWVR